MHETRTRQRVAGCLFGMALGDALGAETEFLSVEEIRKRFPPDGPRELSGNPILFTDDTQMALALGQALLRAQKPYTAATVERPLREAFIAWNRSPENNRAPGMTCIRACEGLERSLPWIKATIMGSKGCGANMRVAPVGVLAEDEDGIDAESRAALAQFQAALTHGHPTGLAAADLTARAIAELIAGMEPARLPQHLRAYALSQRTRYHESWLGELWRQSEYGSSPQEYIARGWDECLGALDRLDEALRAPDRVTDPCLQTGAGWIAEEAFATGLLCFLLYPDEPVAAIRRAAISSGDSDSIACLTGAFAGAYNGLEAWPAAWISRIEHREELEMLANI